MKCRSCGIELTADAGGEGLCQDLCWDQCWDWAREHGISINLNTWTVTVDQWLESPEFTRRVPR